MLSVEIFAVCHKHIVISNQWNPNFVAFLLVADLIYFQNESQIKFHTCRGLLTVFDSVFIVLSQVTHCICFGFFSLMFCSTDFLVICKL